MSTKLIATMVGAPLICLAVLVVWGAPGEAMGATGPGSTGQTKLDVDLEKYWGQTRSEPAVKNQSFTKDGRMELGLFGGMVTSDPFRNYWIPGVRAAYFPLEYLGVSLSYGRAFYTDSSLEEWLNQRLPQKEGEMGDVLENLLHVDVIFSPIYGKLNLFGRAALRFDLYLQAGAGWAGTEYVEYDELVKLGTKSHNSFLLNGGVGFRFYATDFLSVRLEMLQYAFSRNPNFDGREKFWDRVETPTMFALGLSGMLPAFGGGK